jgi:hypothetical protein
LTYSWLRCVFKWVTSPEAPSQHTWANGEHLVNADGRPTQSRHDPDHGRAREAALCGVGGIDDPSVWLRRASVNHCSANLSNISRFFGSPVCPAACVQSCANHSYSAVSVITASTVLSRQRRYLVPFPQLACHLNARTSATSWPALEQVYGPARSLRVKRLRCQGRREEPANFMRFEF